MTDLTDFGVTFDGDAWYDPSLCHALVDGDQCSNGYETEASDEEAKLCWSHADSDRLKRVDDYPDPNLDLRDDLLEETDLGSSIALGLSTLADDVEELWQLLIEGDPVEFGGKEHAERALPNWAADVAQHPSLDVDDHLWSHQQCIAITGKGDRCPNSGYGPTRMCGMHQDTDDPDTVVDEEDAEEDDCSSWDVKEELGFHGVPANAIAEAFDGPLEVISYYVGADGDFTDIDGIGEATSGELANVVTHDLIPEYGKPGTTQWRVSQGKLDPVDEEDAEA